MNTPARRTRSRSGAQALLLLAPMTVFGGLLHWRAGQDAALTRRPADEDERVLGGYVPPLGPAARVASGAATQGGFTLLAVTRTGRRGQEPPEAVLARPSSLAPFVDTYGDGTGVWIGVRGGVGMRTLMVPLHPSGQILRIGGDTLVVRSFGPFSEYRSQWYGSDGVTPLPANRWPFVVLSERMDGPAGHLKMTLVPRDLSARFAVTAQPLTDGGAPAGGPIRLACQPAASDALFVRLPAGYSSATRRMAVTVARAGAPADRAAWTLTDLPPARRNGPDDPLPRPALTWGVLTVAADALEAPDTSGVPDGFTIPPPQSWNSSWNADSHPMTGAPTLRARLRVRAAGGPAPARVRLASGWQPSDLPAWAVWIEQATPQWQVPPAPILPGARPPRREWLRLPAFTGAPGQACWLDAGAAYPGQQHWLEVAGQAVHYAYRFETVTLHDADLVPDGPSGRVRIVWRRAQTVTTPSGVSVTALNARPDRPDPEDAPDWPTHGAEMFLAWHPAGGKDAPFLNWDADMPDASSLVSLPPFLAGAGGLRAHPWTHSSTDWHDVWVPGLPLPAPILSMTGHLIAPPTRTTPLGPLARTGWRPLRYVVMPTAGAGLPRHLGALVLRIPLRSETARRPFILTVPVARRPAPGAGGALSQTNGRGMAGGVAPT